MHNCSIIQARALANNLARLVTVGTLRVSTHVMPQQSNNYDCGVYVMFGSECIADGLFNKQYQLDSKEIQV